MIDATARQDLSRAAFSPWWLAAAVALPIGVYIAHFLVMAIARPVWPEWYLSELGPYEMFGGLLFLGAGVVIGVGLLRYWRALPLVARFLLLGFAGASMFVGLEELSYGQHLFGWRSSQFFDSRNVQQETNLHNLYSQRPQRLMSNAGEIGIVIIGLILPAVFHFSRDAYDRGHWPRYLVPRWELATVACLSLSLRLLKNRHPIILEHKATDEFMEFLWSIAAMLLSVVIYKRMAREANVEQDAAATLATDQAPGGAP